MMTHFLTFMRNPFAFLSTGGVGVALNKIGAAIADQAQAVQAPPPWVGYLAEWLGLGVALFSAVCGSLAAAQAIGTRITRMRNGESFWAAFFTKEKQ